MVDSCQLVTAGSRLHAVQPPQPTFRSFNDRYSGETASSSRVATSGYGQDPSVHTDLVYTGASPVPSARDDLTEVNDETAETPLTTQSSGRHRTKRDAVFDQTTDRQVLVVGDSTVGRVLTTLLQRAGFDPLLSATSQTTSEPTVTYLSGPAVELLDSLGFAAGVLSDGVPIERVAIRPPDAAEATPSILSTGTETGLPLVVSTRDLRQALENTGRDTSARKSVDTLDRRDSGIVVEFENGVQEWFDIVVDATVDGQALPAVDGNNDSTVLTEWELSLDTSVENRITDLWHPATLIQRVPRPGSGTLLRVTAANDEGETSITDAVRDVVGDNGVVPADQTSTVSRTARRVCLPDGAISRSWWGSGRVCIVGGLAGLSIPASACPVALGIENAVALVSELTWNGHTAMNAVAAYTAGRARRFRETPRTTPEAGIDDEYSPSTTIPTPLRDLIRLRIAALATPVDPLVPPGHHERES